ncbi:hypothetical protein ABZ743_05000 [Streptomyces sp. NPDC006662]|uniref:hypothetical protein n=1 Tax=Streptomyces sp. NPDC006662 TaxID=3156902 RepID=UPI0033FA3B23
MSQIPTNQTDVVPRCDCNAPWAGTGGRPTPDLLDRARVGWERFLDTFEGAHDE